MITVLFKEKEVMLVPGSLPSLLKEGLFPMAKSTRVPTLADRNMESKPTYLELSIV